MDRLDQTLFTFLGYPMSLLEFAGVLTGLAAVYLASRAKSVNFLFGIVNSAIYFILFFRFRLYSIMLLQIVYFIFNLYGYYHWKHPKKEESDNNFEQRIRILRWKDRALYMVIILFVGFLWGWSVIHLQMRFPQYFDPPTYPRLDAILTIASVAGQWLLSRKIWDNWPLWVIIDVISCVLYASIGMFFTSVLYGAFAAIAVIALIGWLKTYKTYSKTVLIDRIADINTNEG